MSDNEKRTKPKYESPTVVALGELARGAGACTNNGSADTDTCTFFGSAAQSTCTDNGAFATTKTCTNGTNKV